LLRTVIKLRKSTCHSVLRLGQNGPGWVQALQDFHRCVMTGDPADGAAALSARTTKVDIFMLGLNAPLAGVVRCCRERKGQGLLEDVDMIKPDRVFDVNGALALDAKAYVARSRQAVFQRLG